MRARRRLGPTGKPETARGQAMSLGNAFLQQRFVGVSAGAENHMPPLADYEAWTATLGRMAGNGHYALTAAQYRRIATMKRAGESFGSIGRAITRSTSGVNNAWMRLPEHLR